MVLPVVQELLLEVHERLPVILLLVRHILSVSAVVVSKLLFRLLACQAAEQI